MKITYITITKYLIFPALILVAARMLPHENLKQKKGTRFEYIFLYITDKNFS